MILVKVSSQNLNSDSLLKKRGGLGRDPNTGMNDPHQQMPVPRFSTGCESWQRNLYWQPDARLASQQKNRFTFSCSVPENGICGDNSQ